MRFGVIYGITSASDFFCVFSMVLEDIKNKETPRYIKNQGENVIDLCILFMKTLLIFNEREKNYVSLIYSF